MFNLVTENGKIVRAQRSWAVRQPNKQTINYIVAFDKGKLGRGGYDQVIKEGLNRKNVTSILQSRISQPLDFNIRVNATPNIVVSKKF